MSKEASTNIKTGDLKVDPQHESFTSSSQECREQLLNKTTAASPTPKKAGDQPSIHLPSDSSIQAVQADIRQTASITNSLELAKTEIVSGEKMAQKARQIDHAMHHLEKEQLALLEKRLESLDDELEGQGILSTTRFRLTTSKIAVVVVRAINKIEGACDAISPRIGDLIRGVTASLKRAALEAIRYACDKAQREADRLKGKTTVAAGYPSGQYAGSKDVSSFAISTSASSSVANVAGVENTDDRLIKKTKEEKLLLSLVEDLVSALKEKKKQEMIDAEEGHQKKLEAEIRKLLAEHPELYGTETLRYIQRKYVADVMGDDLPKELLLDQVKQEKKKRESPMYS